MNEGFIVFFCPIRGKTTYNGLVSTGLFSLRENNKPFQTSLKLTNLIICL
jgi:hypothetical protein